MEKPFKTVRRFIHEEGLVRNGDRILLAVSGGPDSVFLFHFFLWYSLKMDIEITAVYIHHHLRPEADSEQEFVRRLAEAGGVPFHSRDVDIEGSSSVEEEARKKRYLALAEIARIHDYPVIATGHTLDDQAETVVMNILRGAGLGGMRGILPLRYLDATGDLKIIRPLLSLEKRLIVDSLEKADKKYLVDKSNLSDEFFRNRIRNRIMPELYAFRPGLKKNLARLAIIVKDDFSFIRRKAADAIREITEGEAINVSLYRGLDTSIKRMAAALIVESFTGSLYRSFEKIERVKEAIERCSSEKIGLDELQNVIDGKRDRPLSVKMVPLPLKIPGMTPIPGGVSVEAEIRDVSGDIFRNERRSIGYFDIDKTGLDVIARNRRRGDRFHPLGMKEDKRLSRFLIDRKVPRDERDGIYLFESGDCLIWVAGLDVSERFKVDSHTRRVLRLEIKF